MHHLNSTHFVGASGPVQFRGADRSGIINIGQYNGNRSTLIGQYLPDRNASDRLVLNTSKIKWLAGERPVDGIRGE